MDDEGLSIEETNALRAKLGLKPLNVGSNITPASEATGGALTTEQQDSLAAANYKRKQEEDKKARDREAAAERIRKVRERAERQRLLVGKTLGEEEDEEDTLSWIKRTKSQAAPEVKPKQQEAAASYSTANLAGLKVGHNLEDVDGGEDVILTLKDGDVLDDEAGDELVNVSIAEQERTKKRLERKKRKSVYAADDDEDMDEATGERKILAHYDHDMDEGAPQKEAGFVITENGNTQKIERPAPIFKSRTYQNLDAPAPTTETSDYVTEVKLKKRQKKTKTYRKRESDDTPVAQFTIAKKAETKDDDLNFVDDDDLQAALARQRRLTVQKRIRPEEIAAQIAAHNKPEDHSEPAGLVLDDASEFTRSLMDIKLPEPKPEKPKEEPIAEDVDMKEAVVAAEPDIVPKSTGIADEATLSQGIGSAMKLLLEKGIITRNEEEQKLQQEKEAWLAQDRKIRLELEMERKHAKDEIRKSGAWEKMSQREREAWAAAENRRIDALEARMAQERFKHYKPNVELKYVDDFGRNMNQKEAFKHLSHQFHGKDSGSGKTAAKLAKIEKEKRGEQRAIFR
jgi:U4/U6.U5 tri-snRNP-associated protein 1